MFIKNIKQIIGGFIVLNGFIGYMNYLTIQAPVSIHQYNMNTFIEQLNNDTLSNDSLNFIRGYLHNDLSPNERNQLNNIIRQKIEIDIDTKCQYLQEEISDEIINKYMDNIIKTATSDFRIINGQVDLSGENLLDDPENIPLLIDHETSSLKSTINLNIEFDIVNQTIENIENILNFSGYQNSSFSSTNLNYIDNMNKIMNVVFSHFNKADYEEQIEQAVDRIKHKIFEKLMDHIAIEQNT